MASYVYGPFVAVDPTQIPSIAKSAAGKAYALEDDTYTTPLAMTDMAGITLTDAVSNAEGLVQSFKVEDHTEIVWKSGNYVVPARSYGGVLDQATAAAEAAQLTASQATAAASSAANSAAAAQAAADSVAGGGGGGGGNGYVLLNPTDPDPAVEDVIPGALYVRLVAPGGDIEAPTVPTGFSPSSITTTGWTLDWANSTDNTDPSPTYEVSINGGAAIPAATSNYTATGLSSGVLFAVRVRSVDDTGNKSAWSTPQNITTLSGGPSAQHSIFGSTDPGGVFALNTDGTPSIELGHGYYKFGSGTGYYSGMRILGAKIWKPSTVTMPAQVTIRLYTGTPTSSDLPTSLGTLVTSKASSPTWVNGWNNILFDAPVAMPDSGQLALLTYQFTSSGDAGKYLAATGGLKTTTDSYQALDGTKLVWADRNPGSGYYDNLLKIGVGSPGKNGSASINFGIDILVDEG